MVTFKKQIELIYVSQIFEDKLKMSLLSYKQDSNE